MYQRVVGMDTLPFSLQLNRLRFDMSCTFGVAPEAFSGNLLTNAPKKRQHNITSLCQPNQADHL